MQRIPSQPSITTPNQDAYGTTGDDSEYLDRVEVGNGGKLNNSH